MKTYELAIERKQPSCGGRAPTSSEVHTVTTADPLAYVRSVEVGSEPVLVEESDGVVVYQVERNGFVVKYEFTEE